MAISAKTDKEELVVDLERMGEEERRAAWCRFATSVCAVERGKSAEGGRIERRVTVRNEKKRNSRSYEAVELIVRLRRVVAGVVVLGLVDAEEKVIVLVVGALELLTVVLGELFECITYLWSMRL